MVDEPKNPYPSPPPPPVDRPDRDAETPPFRTK